MARLRRWASLISVFRYRSDTATGRLRLVQAYQAVFQGSPTKQDQEMVLADMRAASGFDRVSHPALTDSELRQQEGKRQLYAETIHDKLVFSTDDYDALVYASRVEAAAQQND